MFGERKSANLEEFEVDVDVDEENSGADDGFDQEDESAETEHGTAANGKPKPLFDEVILLPVAKGKNAGGSRAWRCKHCNKKFTSSYTRIRQHFFGAGPGQKAQISRCTLITTDREKYKKIYEKVRLYT
jgi:hypothetical protein